MESGRQRSFHVLIVDDNAADRELTSILLSSVWPFERDLEIDHAEDGPQALEKLHAKKFALVILDWRMPLMNGDEVLGRMRAAGLRAPVIVMSGLSREEMTMEFEKLGAVYLSKEEMTTASFHRAIAQSLKLLGFTLPPTTDRPVTGTRPSVTGA
jgi:two-component system, response regulator, stage 0 sporulation protein F